LLTLATSADVSRFNVDEDGDVNADGTITAAGFSGNATSATSLYGFTAATNGGPVAAGQVTGTLDNTNMPDPLIVGEIQVATIVVTNAPTLIGLTITNSQWQTMAK